MPGDFSIKNSMSLEEIWTNVANSNKEGDPNSIDSKEVSFNYGSIYFIEEGMTEQEFYAKNLAIYDTQPKMQNGMFIAELKDRQKETLSSAVSRVVNQMLDNGEFEAKRDIIMGKLPYLDVETKNRVIEQDYKINPQLYVEKYQDFEKNLTDDERKITAELVSGMCLEDYKREELPVFLDKVDAIVEKYSSEFEGMHFVKEHLKEKRELLNNPEFKFNYELENK